MDRLDINNLKIGPNAITEYRIVLPMSVEEYHVGQLYSVAECSKQETGGGEGVEVLTNEPFDEENFAPVSELVANGAKYTTGQYTHKVYHFKHKIPKFIAMLAPKGSLCCQERAWNAYPYCRTVVTNESYMKENFFIIIDTFHYADNGQMENIHGLSPADLEKRKIIKIDVACDEVSRKDYKEEFDPTKVAAPESGRPDPLPKDPNWINEVKPVMCCYKLVRVLFKWWGLQKRVESIICKTETRIFLNFHRQVVCWQDKYHGMTIEQIRELENKTKDDLNQMRVKDPLKGAVAEE